MRLTPEQTEIVVRTIRRQAGESALVFLFGSRLDDQARGGDIDLLIETAAPMTLLDRARLKHELEAKLELPVDLVVHDRGAPPTPFQQIAQATAIALRIPQ
jgi:predicted nucleotidyltransferase